MPTWYGKLQGNRAIKFMATRVCILGENLGAAKSCIFRCGLAEKLIARFGCNFGIALELICRHGMASCRGIELLSLWLLGFVFWAKTLVQQNHAFFDVDLQKS